MRPCTGPLMDRLSKHLRWTIKGSFLGGPVRNDQGTAESPCECQTKTDLVDDLFVGHPAIDV